MDHSFTMVNEFLYPLIIGAGIFSGIRLLSFGTTEIKIANRLLVMLLFVLILPMWDTYVKRVLTSDLLSPGWPFDSAYWLIAPLMYLYLTEISSNSPNRRLYLFHFAPFVAVAVLGKVTSMDRVMFFKVSLVFWIIFTLVYLVLLFLKLLQRRREYQQFHSSTLAIEFKWILGLLLGLMVFVIFDVFVAVYLLLDRSYPGTLINSYVFVRSLYVVGIIVHTIYYKIVLKKPLDLPADIPPKKNSLSQLRLTDSAAKSLESMLNREMEKCALFSSPSLNLRELSAHLGVTTHQLSELFNAHMNTSFHRYVNLKRIDYAKIMLSKNSEKPIVDIAVLCGYNNKTTFYDNFKKICGMTPKEYREEAV